MAQSNIDSLENKLANIAETEQLNILIALSKANWNISPSKGMQYADEATALARKFGDVKKQSKALLYGGVNAIYAGSYDLAIEYFQNSLNLADSVHDKKQIAFNLNNLGMVYNKLSSYKQAITYYTKAAQAMLDLGDEIEYAKVRNNIGKLYLQMGDNREALHTHLRILKLVEKSDEKMFYVLLLCDIGNVYKKMKNTSEAKKYYLKALEISKEIDDKLGKSIIHRNIGELYFNEKSYQVALDHFYEALDIANGISSKDEIVNCYYNISKVYEETGRYKKALGNFKLFKMADDSIRHVNVMERIVEIETKYETERKEKENNLLRKNIEIRHLEVEKQTYLRNLFIAASVFAVLIVFLVYSRFRAKKKLNASLSIKNKLITKQKDKLIELDKFKEQMTGAFVHDLKNPLNVILNLSQNQYVKQAGNIMHNLVMNMLDVYKYENNKMHIIQENYAIQEITVQAMDEVMLLGQQKNLAIVNNTDAFHLVFADIDVIKRVLVNILTNAIKFSPNNGKIIIESREISSGDQVNDTRIKISISDNGPGIPKDKIPLVFKKFGQVQSKSSGSVRSTGLGLAFCKMAIEAHEGEIGVVSEPGQGACFWFTLLKGKRTTETKSYKTNTPKQHLISLTDKDKELLKPYCDELKNYMVYEATKIRRVLSSITNKGQAIKKWKTEIENAVFSMNKEMYKRLIELE